MEEFEQRLRNLVLAPYILRATRLITLERKTAGNQFRHAMATLTILLDYKYSDEILLKASIIHDLLEDTDTSENDLLTINDPQINKVLDLVIEVTRKKTETKIQYLNRLLNSEKSSVNARILKIADRISNLTDLSRANYSIRKMSDYIKQSEDFVLPMAEGLQNKNMAIELRDLIKKRKEQVYFLEIPRYFRFRKLLSIFI